MSDEDVSDPFGDDSEDDYVPTEASSTDSENENRPLLQRTSKKRKKETSSRYSANTDCAPGTSNIDQIIEAVACQGQPEGQPDSSDISEVEGDSLNVTWGPVTGKNLKSFHFDASSCGVPTEVKAHLVDKSPYQFYKFFVADHIIKLMVTETNRYAQQTLENAYLSRFSRLRKWKEVTAEEMEKFLGIIFWMGLNKKPKLSDYWSKKIIYENKVKYVMSRNRFELILRMWHLSNNQQCPGGDRLFKIKQLIDLPLERFQSAIIPAKDLCIDETMVPFRG
nr:unnamed protein product [Callosobruchus analis]